MRAKDHIEEFRDTCRWAGIQDNEIDSGTLSVKDAISRIMQKHHGEVRAAAERWPGKAKPLDVDR